MKPGHQNAVADFTDALIKHDVRQVKGWVGLHWGQKHTRLINKHDETSVLMNSSSKPQEKPRTGEFTKTN